MLDVAFGTNAKGKYNFFIDNMYTTSQATSFGSLQMTIMVILKIALSLERAYLIEKEFSSFLSIALQVRFEVQINK